MLKLYHFLKSYLSFFAMLYFWYILIGRAHNFVCFDPFIISKIEIQTDNFINQTFERSQKTYFIPSTTDTCIVSNQQCCNKITLNSKRRNPMVLGGRKQTFKMKKETILTPITTQINKVPTVPGGRLGSWGKWSFTTLHTTHTQCNASHCH